MRSANLAGKPGPFPHTTWHKARDLKPGMRISDGTGYDRTVTSTETDDATARTRITFAPTGHRADTHPPVIYDDADAPWCTEDTTR